MREEDKVVVCAGITDPVELVVRTDGDDWLVKLSEQEALDLVSKVASMLYIYVQDKKGW